MPVAEARRRILEAAVPLPAEVVPLSAGLGRVLAEPVVARRTQPPFDVSAMDGWAVRAADVASVPAVLRRVGEAPAGRRFPGAVGPGECVRIFTGAPVPDGADAVVIQEDADADGDRVTMREAVAAGRHVRRAGLDFREGEDSIPAGTVLTARHVGLAAAMGWPWLRVRRRPRVAVLATGDEIALPGEPLGPDQIVSANGPALAAFVAACGGEAVDLGVAPDDADALARMAEAALGHDVLVTTGGASVGEHDLVREGLVRGGMELGFWKIAMRPGKPLMTGRIGRTAVLGLPGNPVSSLVCALLFLRPLLLAMQGVADPGPRTETARLGAAMGENDGREDYVRAEVAETPGGLVATPLPRQDSSMFRALASSGGLIVRPVRAPALPAGAEVPVLRFPGSPAAI
jgi:molybdopterin molybdotransferase